MQASDQKTDGTNVVIDRVILRGASGYVAIHLQHGEPWPLIGASRLLPAQFESNEARGAARL